MNRWLKSTCVSCLLLWGFSAIGCNARSDAPAEAEERYQISAKERPEALVAGASRRLADVIGPADIGRDFGLPAWQAPYPDTYWPFSNGGSDASWNPNGLDPRSPLEKYMAITNPAAIDRAKAWEHDKHGTGAPDLATWYGHCPGWAAAATTNAPIRHPVFAGPDGFGGIAPCRPGDFACTRFEIGDINALMAEVYLDGPAAVIGSACGTEADAIPRDESGRITKAGCAGVNAGSMLVVAASLLKYNRIPFAVDAQNPRTTAEIWNQPTYRYHVYDYHPITASEAANLVAHGDTAGPETQYRWNADARGFAFADIGLQFVGEHGPQVNFMPGTSSTYEMRLAMVLELDADPANPAATILGGEYLDLPSSRADRLTVSPIVWVSRGPGPEYLPEGIDGTHHNPFVRPSLVRRLIAFGQQ
jgi:hypothetical protein